MAVGTCGSRWRRAARDAAGEPGRRDEPGAVCAALDGETTVAVMTALRECSRLRVADGALQRPAGWAFHTPTAKGPVNKKQLTQVGRALAQLGSSISRLLAPGARRSERLNRTLQDRLVNELRVAGITTISAANQYLRDVFLPQHNATFSDGPGKFGPP